MSNGFYWKFNGAKMNEIFWVHEKDESNQIKYDIILNNNDEFIQNKKKLGIDSNIKIEIIDVFNSYNNIIKQIKEPKSTPKFNKGGKLIIALFEWRCRAPNNWNSNNCMITYLKWIINAILKVYNSNEIGFALVYGENNYKQIESSFSNWENIVLVKTNDSTHNAYTYSKRLYTPELWENFKSWKYVLVYQWDALLLRQIPEMYFEYDYIGAPIAGCPHSGGNGGFSLRNVEKTIEACEKYRGNYYSIYNIKERIGHEDGYFGQGRDNFKYVKNKDEHKEFAIESLHHDNPVGLHKVFHWYRQRCSTKEWLQLLENIKSKLLN
jgi:hypothetical protein